ncbi:MAG: cyclic nucleotide-binding domain-containing protein [Bacteroidales bacterium]|nr:cyclic nucleotide-binding domain-containing protein [Bacteroidales bacterium]
METIVKENACKDCAVKSSTVFNLDEEELDQLCSNSTEIKFQKGERIIKQGAFTQNIVFIKSGIIKVHLTGPIQKDVILKIDKGPIFVGVPDVFANKVHSYSVTALNDTTACFIEYKGYEYLIQNNGMFALELIKTLSYGIVSHYQYCVNKLQKQLTATFAEALLYFSDKLFESDEFHLPLTRVQFGEYIGTTRETITKIIHDFAVDHLIAVDGKKVKIIKRDILIKISKAG